MHFQILKIIIWPKDKDFSPQEINFKPGKLNIIAGGSRTGKSAIIPIIDYCLASTKCNIPIDTIRTYASWYGILIQTDIEEILISRRAPNEGAKASNEFYISRDKSINTPTTIATPNETKDGIKNILNEISHIPSFALDYQEDKKGFTDRLSFRDLMSLVFQSQDIVANQNIFFYKTHAHVHREKLRNWFPFILGSEDIETLKARQRLQYLEKTLKRKEREYDSASKISDTWTSSLKGHIQIAKEYGLTKDEIHDEITPEEIITIVKRILKNSTATSTFINIGKAIENVMRLEEEETCLSIKIGNSKKRLKGIKNLEYGLNKYSDSIQKKVDRLHISKWFEDLSFEKESCPSCGSKDHPKSGKELLKISQAFRKHEKEAASILAASPPFLREEEGVKKELEDLLEQQKGVKARYDLVLSKDTQKQVEFQKRKNMFLFLGHLTASMETFESLIGGGELKKELDDLRNEYNGLINKVDQNLIGRKVDIASRGISKGILNHLKTLDVEETYKITPPIFDIKDLNISVLSRDNNKHFLAEVGSASNWVSFHIALMCSLQEYFLEQSSSSVPNFVIFDQPSQAYFPRIRKKEEGAEIDHRHRDEDVDAVKKIFKTISNSISATGNKWQSIVLDHADSSIYGEIEDIHEIDWHNGNKLIPVEWYEQ